MTQVRWSRFGPAVLVSVTVVVTGCSASPEVPSVPEIENARDARDVDPCGVPRSAQLVELGVTESVAAGDAPEGPQCAWSDGRGTTFTLTLFTGGDGLTTLAENSEPTTARVRFAGYPALETFTGAGEFCQYDVGVAAEQAVLASLEGGVPDSCTALQAVLPAVLSNLPTLAE